MNLSLRPSKPKPKPTKTAKGKQRKQKTNRQKLMIELSNLCRKITTWRDGCVCVLAEVDGGSCNAVSQWGHVVAQGGSGFLKHSLSNSFRQCGNHNLIHNNNPLIYVEWYRAKFGSRAVEMLREASKKTYHKFTTPELWAMRDEMIMLYKERREMSRVEMVEAGYYGDIIKEAWIKDGKI